MRSTTINRLENLVKSKRSKTKSSPALDAQGFAQRVEKKAYELYAKRGCEPGHDWEDWFEAERLVEKELITSR